MGLKKCSDGHWIHSYRTAEMSRVESSYIRKRLFSAKIQSILFYLSRFFPIKKNKIVFTTIEGTTGFTCNPKYIALELARDNKNGSDPEKWELVWLVNDMGKDFPREICKVKNTLINRAFHLTTARFWIDNSRKQLEVRKRKGQIYIQTWHARLGFKPTCLDRGESFSKIAYLVSKHDSDMVDYWISNSDWYDKTLKTGSLYEGKTIRSGSPRCDILVNRTDEDRQRLREKFGLDKDARFMLYAPTFRGGSQETDRAIHNDGGIIDHSRMVETLEKRFGGTWYVFLRLHPQLVARNIKNDDHHERVIDVSTVDDMYEILAGCDAFLTDYSSAAFDAAVMKIPVFLYCYDYADYEGERGKLLWDMKKLPFPMAETQEELFNNISIFDEGTYIRSLDDLFEKCGIIEDGKGSETVVKFIKERSLWEI